MPILDEKDLSEAESLRGIEHLIPKETRPPMTSRELGITREMLASGPIRPFKKTSEAEYARLIAKVGNRKEHDGTN